MNFAALFIDRFIRIISRRQVIKGMVLKNLKDKYVSSTLGIAWAVVTPVLIMFVITFVFSHILKTEIKYFPLMVLSALLPWFFFVNSICESTHSMARYRGILNQFIIPPEAVCFSIVSANFINFLFGFIVMVPIFIIFNKGISSYIFLLPLVMFLHFIFTLGVSVLFSVVNIYFKDFPYLLDVGLMFLFWITPVFYLSEMIPASYRWMTVANPTACYIILYRSLLYYGMPGEIHVWLIAAGFSLVSIIIGYIIFIKNEAEILKYT